MKNLKHGSYCLLSIATLIADFSSQVKACSCDEEGDRPHHRMVSHLTHNSGCFDSLLESVGNLFCCETECDDDLEESGHLTSNSYLSYGSFDGSDDDGSFGFLENTKKLKEEKEIKYDKVVALENKFYGIVKAPIKAISTVSDWGNKPNKSKNRKQK